MIEYPKMLYKDGGSLEVDKNFYSFCIVENEEQEEKKIEEGWKHKAVQGEGLEEKYKIKHENKILETENEELRKQLEELKALKELDKNEEIEIIEKVVEPVKDIEKEVKEEENKLPKGLSKKTNRRR